MRSSRCVDQLFLSDRQASTVEMLGKSLFSFLPLSSSLYLFLFFSHVCFSSFLFFFFPFSLSYPLNFLSFVCSPSHFFFIFPFLFFSHFLLLFFFLFSFLHFLFSISLFCYHQPNGPKVGETSPHFPPLPLVFFTFFLNFLFIFISFFFLHLTLGSI